MEGEGEPQAPPPLGVDASPSPAVPPPPPGVSEDLRNDAVFQDSVPVSQVPPDRRGQRAAAGGDGAGRGAAAAAAGGGGGARGAAKSGVRRPNRVREPVPAPGETSAGASEEWAAAAAMSFSKVDPVVNPKTATSALAAALGGAQPQRLPNLARPAVPRRSSNRDNLNLQVSVDVSDASGAFQRIQLIVFSKCTVDQVIGMTLRECKKLDAETDWGSERDYELYVVDASGPAAGIDPDTNPLQGSQKIGDFPGQLNFALVRVPDEDTETSSPALRPEGDAGPSATASIATEQESTRIPPPIVAQQLKSAAEELSENVGTQNVCKHCGERIDFIQVSPDKIGSLKKQMDHTGLWRDRWFQLYGNHLVYWSAAKEDLDLASGRGVIHLDADVTIAPSQPPAPPPAVDSTALATGPGDPSSAGSASHDRGTIMAGSMTRSVMAGEETHAGRKLLTQGSDPLDDSIEGSSQTLAGGAAGPGDSGAMPLDSARLASVQTSEDAVRVRASGAFPDLRLPGTAGVTDTEFLVVLPHKTYKFRAATSQERDSWIAALKQSAQTLFHTCLFCWKNVDPSSSVDQTVVCSGHLCIQLNPKLPKQFDKRWMVCTTNRRAGSTHIVYYNERSHEGNRPAQGCIHLYEGENRVSVYASEFEQRTDDVSGVEYTVYKLNVRRGDDRHVLHKRWSKCDKLQKDIAREHKLPATVYLPKKWQQTNDVGRLEKRRCQLNHYFAELSGWANREGLDLWNPSVSEAFTAFIREPDDGTDDGRSSLRVSGAPSPPVERVDSEHPDGSHDTDAATSWEDSYLTIRSERTRETLVPQPRTRLGSFAFGVSQSRPSDSSGGGGSAASPTVSEVVAGSPRETSGHNPMTASAALEALRESESELGDRSPIGRDSGGGKHFLHLQSPLKTYYLYAETEDDLNRWLDALALPWLGTMDSSPRSRSASAQRVAAADSARQEGGEGAESEPAFLGGDTSGNTRARSSSYARPGRLDTRVSLSSRNLEQ